MSNFISCKMSWTLSEHSSRCRLLHKRCFLQIKAARLRLAHRFQSVITLNGLSEHTSNNHRRIHLWSRLYRCCLLPANQLAPCVTNPPDRFNLELSWFRSVKVQRHHPALQNSLWWGSFFFFFVRFFATSAAVKVPGLSCVGGGE